MITNFIYSVCCWLFSWNTILVLLCLGVAAYYFGTRNHDYFARNRIPSPPAWPFLGNSGKWILGKASFYNVFQELYSAFPTSKVFGLFDFMGPVYVIRDFDLIKQICVKDFDSFIDRRFQFDEHSDPLFSNALFSLKGVKWKNMRSILSPAFTGSKMRHMLRFINEYCSGLNATLESMIAPGESKEFELEDFLTKVSCDIIATCAFGLQMNNVKDGENEFYKMSRYMTHLNNWQWFKFVLFSSFPSLAKMLGFTLFGPECTEFMRKTIKDIIDYRDRTGTVRQDLIHLLMLARDQKLKFEDTDRDLNNLGLSTAQDYPIEEIGTIPDWTLDVFVSQCFVFIFGGLDTVSKVASFMAHELAIHPEVQEKLYTEIKTTLKAKGSEPITYEDIQSLAYMDRVVTETLRKWPQAQFIDRVCTKPYNLDLGDDKSIPLVPGDFVWIPAMPLQRDPKYFPDPERFDPDRFAPERRDSLGNFVHLSFGIGPRNCLGNRFALMEMKTVFFWILSKFEITPSSRTQNPLRIGKSLMVPQVEGGIYLNFKNRQPR
ncbi:cytochrome P450 9e2-like [Uranotaenia lowii]|uniref:cytochrome P450 9e2-like n=1 Tax=Uranotaenia lowii TaxID=190385 RepID=UPI00247B0C7A|nr:cytochrome P450 9e2-like [Uranotaenia lowii]